MTYLRIAPIGRLGLGVLVAACSAVPEGTVVEEDLLDTATQEIKGGVSDIDSRTANAVVSVQGDVLCTGTLVAPDVVLTAGHCLGSTPVPPANNQNWQTLGGGKTLTVKFGRDPNNPNFTATATAHNATGAEDIMLLGLTGGLAEERVPSSIAMPREVLFAEPPDITDASLLWHAGYGVGATTRQLAVSRGYRRFQVAAYPDVFPNYFCFDDVDGDLQPGDSGSPVMWGFHGPVMGVYQGNATCNSHWESPSAPTTGERDGATMTYGPGLIPGKTNLAWWLQRHTQRSYCSLTKGTRSETQGARYRRLQSWWSSRRSDNFISTKDFWRGCFEDWDYEPSSDGYAFFRFDGWVAAAEFSQPSGTVPLRLYWNPTSKDNAALISHPGGGYQTGSVLGYIWTHGASNRRPLHAWYSSGRRDYFTTTQTQDYTGSGYVRVGSGPIGYVKTPESVDASSATTCENACGARSNDGCWCDSLCSSYDDCCDDYQTVCE